MKQEDFEDLKGLIEDLQVECKYFKSLINQFEKHINKIHPESKILKIFKNLPKHID